MQEAFSRLWLSSMEDSAIRKGFANLKPSTEYDALYNAALCRECADWMVGINATRLFSCLYGQPLAVGRVMTPTLAMTVVRESRVPIKQYLQKFPQWGRFGVTSVTPFLLLPVHPEGCTPTHRT